MYLKENPALALICANHRCRWTVGRAQRGPVWMSHYLEHWSPWRQRVCCFLVQWSCSLEGRLYTHYYSYSAQDVWSWSFLLMSPRHFTCFLGCIGGLSIASAITSILEALFLVLHCFPQDICSTRLQTETPLNNCIPRTAFSRPSRVKMRQLRH